MNFLTQLGVLAVILIILAILIKSNQTLEKIYMEDQNKEEKITPEPEISKVEVPKVEVPKIEVPKIEVSRPSFRSLFGKKSSKEKDREAYEKKVGKKESESEQPSRSQATVPMEKGPDFIIEILDDRGRAIDSRRVSSFPYTIGRNEENDLVLDDLSVSGYHASLEEEEGRIILIDKGSLNKLIVNGRQETKVPINGEVEVGFGNTSLRFIKDVRRSNPTVYYAGTSLMEEWY